jgi:hypothetical protein
VDTHGLVFVSLTRKLSQKINGLCSFFCSDCFRLDLHVRPFLSTGEASTSPIRQSIFIYGLGHHRNVCLWGLPFRRICYLGRFQRNPLESPVETRSAQLVQRARPPARSQSIPCQRHGTRQCPIHRQDPTNGGGTKVREPRPAAARMHNPVATEEPRRRRRRVVSAHQQARK